MISKIQIKKLRSAELLQMSHDVVSICEKKQPAQLLIDPQVAELRTATNLFDSLYKLDQGSEYSNMVLDCDYRRDKYINGIRQMSSGLTNHFEAATVEAATLLLDSIDKYGSGISKMNYQTETSTINSIVDSWNKDSKLAAALELLNIKTWAAELKAANDEFNKVYLSRVEETAQKPSVASVDARKTVVVAYQQLVKHIEARATIDNGSLYTDLIAELNVLVEKYTKTLTMRAPKANGEKTK
jgi:hypothetical protein